MVLVIDASIVLALGICFLLPGNLKQSPDVTSKVTINLKQEKSAEFYPYKLKLYAYDLGRLPGFVIDASLYARDVVNVAYG